MPNSDYDKILLRIVRSTDKVLRKLARQGKLSSSELIGFDELIARMEKGWIARQSESDQHYYQSMVQDGWAPLDAITWMEEHASLQPLERPLPPPVELADGA